MIRHPPRHRVLAYLSGMKVPAKVAMACAVVLAVAGAALIYLRPVGIPTLHRSSGDFADIPLDRSEYLSDVAEPITMIRGMSWDDGGSNGLAFVDSKGRKLSICLMDDLLNDQHLRLGSVTPGKGRAVPLGGIEERAFLGLLERWSRQSPEAKAWEKRIEAWEETTRRSSIFTGDESDHQRGDALAVGLMKRLRRRN